MSLSVISDENLQNEKEIINELFQSSDKFQSLVFNSGAGSGKTFALVECLKHIIYRNRNILKAHNQKVACITYTNVAADHIKKQIGSTDVVEVSTIHERIWEIIREQKPVLLRLHIEKLKNEIQNINYELSNNLDYKNYRELDIQKQEEFYQLMLSHKKDYNRVYNQNASEFRAAMPMELITQYSELIRNVGKFKNLVDKLFRDKRYKECLDKIKSKDKDYREVRYDAMYNRDRLDKMRISHDTLLEYGYQVVLRYPKMRQMIIDCYPYFLVDEYQDTAEVVVNIMNLIDQYGKEIGHNVFVAYFGDSVQNIYDTGVGKTLSTVHKDLLPIKKIYNRRSYKEIVDVANLVRNDEIVQHSIFKDCIGGSIKLYYGSEQEVDGFIDLFSKKWNASITNPLHCMFATNQMVAEYEIHINETPLRKIFPSEDYRNMSFADLKKVMNALKLIEGNSLDTLLISIFEQYSISQNNIYQGIIERLFDIEEETTYDNVLKYLVTSLYTSWGEGQSVKTVIGELLSVKIEVLLNWYHYVQRDEKKDICYHTFHSTKGLEYENVLIILGRDFGIDRGLFENYFMQYGKNLNDMTEKYEIGRNILYVAVTRAIKNLRILYIDELNKIQEKVTSIFGEISAFSEDAEMGK
ncbi:MAG: ATP-dependent helicase [Paenibacillaceae bacterium]|nr:ATP-dependent helicase [Paenibacillaceae bacterium]